jgi:K+-sensing histidine kinase KdpD
MFRSSSIRQNERAARWIFPLGLAITTVAGALLPRVLLHSILQDRSTFVLFTLAVMVSARFGGLFSGAMATAFSIIAGMVVFLGQGADAAEKRADLIEVLLFAVVGLSISYLAQQLRATRHRAEEALAEVGTLTGLLPICAGCKKIKDKEGHWQQLEDYISSHSEAEFSHGFCEECFRRLYPEFNRPNR